MNRTQNQVDINTEILKDYSSRNFQKRSFVNNLLSQSSFSGSDLRGTDFTNADLSGADFSNVKTGIPPFTTVLIFLFALFVSALSGYIAMLACTTVQGMLKSKDQYIRLAGAVASALVVIFIVYCYVKGERKAIFTLFIPVVILSVALGLFFYLSGIGTGMGMFYIALALVLTVIMFLVGTIARVAAGSLSSVLFILVAVTGGFFGRSVGGGIGTVVMAISCALISKKALKGGPGFEFLQRLGRYITAKYGTSFRRCKMARADFSQTKKIRNIDFTDADLALTEWGNCKKINCITGEAISQKR